LGLTPDQLADTVICVGDPERVARISRHFSKVEVKLAKREYVTHTGEFKGKRLTVMSTGMGTDNVEIAMMELDALINLDLKQRTVKNDKKKLKIVRVGTSGSLQPDIKIGSYLVSEYAIGLDTLMFFYNLRMAIPEAEFGYAVQRAAELPFRPYVVKGSKQLIRKFGEVMKKGNTLTAPGFYAPQGRKLRAQLRLPQMMENLAKFTHEGKRLTNFEMETAGYYALAHILEHEAVSVNAILANRMSNEFAEDPTKVVDDLIELVLEKLVD
jgi:uridine phosphorylase